MNEQWVETETEVATVSWDNKPIRLRGVPAIKNTKTGKIRVRPEDVARAELIELARSLDLEPRDLAILMTLKAQPGAFFNKEQVQYQYHLNKMLFYQWIELGKIGMGEAYPHDQFVKADRGPMPANVNADLDRLSKLGLISIKLHRWGPRPKDASKQIALTEKGSKLAEGLLKRIPNPFLMATAEVKVKVSSRTPAAIREMVHSEFPEYRTVYVKEDID